MSSASWWKFGFCRAPRVQGTQREDDRLAIARAYCLSAEADRDQARRQLLDERVLRAEERRVANWALRQNRDEVAELRETVALQQDEIAYLRELADGLEGWRGFEAHRVRVEQVRTQSALRRLKRAHDVLRAAGVILS